MFLTKRVTIILFVLQKRMCLVSSSPRRWSCGFPKRLTKLHFSVEALLHPRVGYSQRVYWTGVDWSSNNRVNGVINVLTTLLSK